MNKYFTITYSVVGGKFNDTIMIWSDTMTNAIKEFINTEIETFGVKVKYTEYAILKVEA
jgi:hypothetical protein